MKENASRLFDLEALKKKLSEHEDRIRELEGKCAGYESQLAELLLLKDRVAKLESQKPGDKITYDYSKTEAAPVKVGERDQTKELENELKHLADRLGATEKELEGFVKRKSDESTIATSETYDGDDEVLREAIENQLQGIKTRLSRVEDSHDEIKNTIDKISNKDDGKTFKGSEVDQEIKFLKDKIEEIEKRLRKLRDRKSPPIFASPEKSDDNSNYIYSLAERLEKLESSHETLTDQVSNHDERITNLEKDNEANKHKISSNKQDIGELKDQISDKVNCDTFDEEIGFLKELLNTLGSGQKVDIQVPAQVSAPKPAISTKDANKMKEIMAKIPELEKLIKELLERVGKAERTISNHDKELKAHDKTIEEILAELAKKANAKDLKDLVDRLSQIEKDIDKIIQHMNSLGSGGGGQPAPLVLDTSEKRMNLLEKKLEELRNDLNNSLRDIGKTLNAQNAEMKDVRKGMDEFKTDFLKLMKKVNFLEMTIDALKKLGGGSSDNITVLQPSLEDGDKLEELKRALNELRGDYKNFKNEVIEKFNQVNNELDTKASKEDLENLKTMLKKRIEDLENALNKTKNDLKRALKILNDKIMAKQEGLPPRDERDDAMFTKKPLQGLSCASCEKNIVNLQGLPADYYNWKKLPKGRDRIPMVGQGFSRMLQSISNEYVVNLNSTPAKTNYPNDFRDLESGNTSRSNLKQRPTSSERKNLHIDDIDTEAASKLLPSIKDANRK